MGVSKKDDIRIEGLMRRLRAGEAQAVDEFLNDYGDAIRREVRFVLLDRRLRRVVADSDIFQSVIGGFLAGLQSGRLEVADQQSLLSLLRQMARIRVAFHARFWAAQRRDLKRSESLSDTSVGGPVDSSPTPAAVIENQDLLSAVFRKMTPHDLKVLDWRLEGICWEEIARRTGAASGEAVRKQHERELDRIAAQVLP